MQPPVEALFTYMMSLAFPFWLSGSICFLATYVIFRFTKKKFDERGW